MKMALLSSRNCDDNYEILFEKRRKELTLKKRVTMISFIFNAFNIVYRRKIYHCRCDCSIRTK